MKDCKDLSNITLPSNINRIGENAFYNCNNIKKVNYLGSIDTWCEINFENEHSNPLVYNSDPNTTNLETITALCIRDKLLTDVNITSATKINSYAFYKCLSLKNVTIGNNVEYIGSDVFYMCNCEIRYVKQAKLNEIKKYAFRGYRGEYVVIPESVKVINEYAFSSCDNLVNVIFNNTSGWKGEFKGIKDIWGSSTIPETTTVDFSEKDLSFAATAATYLRKTYIQYKWERI